MVHLVLAVEIVDGEFIFTIDEMVTQVTARVDLQLLTVHVSIPSFQHVTECQLLGHCTLTSFLPCLLSFSPFVHRQTQLSCTIHSLTSVCAHLIWIKWAFSLQSCLQGNKCHHDITHGCGHVS